VIVIAWPRIRLPSTAVELPYEEVSPYSTCDLDGLSVFHVIDAEVADTLVTMMSVTSGFAGDSTLYFTFSFGLNAIVLCFSVANTHST
jgi:hypothetical protein